MDGRRGGRYRTRLTLGVLALSLPVVALVALVLTRAATQALEDAAKESVIARATTVASTLDDWLAERESDLIEVAESVELVLTEPGARTPVMEATAGAGNAYDVLFLVDPEGQLIAATNEELAFDPSGQEWFEDAVDGQTTFGPVELAGEGLRWMIATPVVTDEGRVAAVALGDLRVEVLGALIGDPGGAASGQVDIARGDRLVVYSTAHGRQTTEEALLRGGVLDPANPAASLVADQALTGQTGAGVYVDDQGEEVLAGYAPVGSVGWAVLAQEDAAEAYSAAARQRLLGVGAVVAGALILGLAAVVLARWQARHLRAVMDETALASTHVRGSAEQLRVAAEELTTSAGAHRDSTLQTGAATEELAAAAVTIADETERIAAQAAEMRESLLRAEAEVTTSGERTLALSGHMHHVREILSLVDDIADQSNLLALNAAIEAARAGEGGRGFRVIADEVRRVAERSKSSTAGFGEVVEATQAETAGALSAVETGSMRLHQGLALLGDVSEASERARMTASQQRAAIEQVVQRMGPAADAGQQVTATCEEVASFAEALASLAGDLERSATATRDRF